MYDLPVFLSSIAERPHTSEANRNLLRAMIRACITVGPNRSLLVAVW